MIKKKKRKKEKLDDEFIFASSVLLRRVNGGRTAHRRCRHNSFVRRFLLHCFFSFFLTFFFIASCLVARLTVDFYSFLNV